MTDDLWYYQLDGRECGPVARDELDFLQSSGAITAAAQVRRADSQQWRSLQTLTGKARPVQRPRVDRFSPAADFRGAQPASVPEADTSDSVSPPATPNTSGRLHSLPAERKNPTLLYITGTLALLALLIWYLWPEPDLQGLSSDGNGTNVDTADLASTSEDSAASEQSAETTTETTETVAAIDPLAQPAATSDPDSPDANSNPEPATSGASGSGTTADASTSPVVTAPEEDLAGVQEQKSSSSAAGLTVGEDTGSRFAISAPGETTFFGLRGAGRRFAYVVDCSGSMQGLPLQRAREELLQSIRKLPPHLEFRIVFFDDFSYTFPQNESRPFLKATPQSIAECEAFIASISGGGGTNVKVAMNEVLTSRVKPDTTFLLTDGQFEFDTPTAIQKWNPRAIVRINTVAFLDPSGGPLLKQIADENRGDYRFVP